MEIEIDRLNLHLSVGMSPARARGLGDLIGEALRSALGPYAAQLSAAPAGDRVSSIVMPGIRVRAGATDDEIAQAVADALARAMLAELEVS